MYVRRIQIGGNTRTRDEVVRREMRQQEAAWYDAGDIKVSRDRVDRLGYFNEVNVKTDPVPGSPDQVDVNVDVKEKPTGIINLGVGYGSSEKAILSAGISEDNVFGSGTNLTLQLNTSKTNRAVVLSHTDPYFTKDGISRTTSAYYRVTEPWDNNDGDYRVKAMGLGMNFGVPISGTTGSSWAARSSATRSTCTTTRRWLSRLRRPVRRFDQRADLQHRLVQGHARQRAKAPTKGAYTRLKGDFSTMDLKYYLLTAQQQYYLPLGRSYTLALNGMIDYGRSYGGLDYPVIKNVYAGGIGTVRGYEGRLAGPARPPHGRLHRRFAPHGGQRPAVPAVPGASKDRTLRWFVFTDAGQVAAGSGMSCTPASRAAKWRIRAAGASRPVSPVVAVAAGPAAAVVCPPAEFQVRRRHAGVPSSRSARASDRFGEACEPLRMKNMEMAGCPAVPQFSGTISSLLYPHWKVDFHDV